MLERANWDKVNGFRNLLRSVTVPFVSFVSFVAFVDTQGVCLP